jgi:anaerobic selenocysteine-containing dehydrogenase
MATQDREDKRKSGLTRRDFLKATAAAAATVGASGAELVLTPSQALAADVASTKVTTCVHCAAQCHQLVDMDADGNYLDIYGDPNSPTNHGGLCSKGAAAMQLVNNSRRLGVPAHTAAVDGFDFTGAAWVRKGNDAWQAVPLTEAMNGGAYTGTGGGTHPGAAQALIDARGADPVPGLTAASNNKNVMFYGCSYMNNEQNYTMRKLMAQFGTSLIEHQARI